MNGVLLQDTPTTAGSRGLAAAIASAAAPRGGLPAGRADAGAHPGHERALLDQRGSINLHTFHR